MKSYKKAIEENIPTMLVFEHAGMHDAVAVHYLVRALKAKYAGKAHVIPVDASYNGQYKVDYKLKEYPTYIVYKQGEELMRESGDKSIAALEDMITRAL
ncbi:MAG: hypothetical protein HDT09_04915 [Bacteroidales bacterium]|nr:hypothetical protein [Bacteroidales bacterium]